MVDGSGPVTAHSFFFESRDPRRDKEHFFQQFRDFSGRAGWQRPIANEVELILEEWWTNLLNYAFKTHAEPGITIQMRVREKRVEIEIRDNGPGFNLLDYPDPDLTLPLEERPIGGLGIYMMKQLSGAITYERAPHQNIVRIEKDLTTPVLGASK